MQESNFTIKQVAEYPLPASSQTHEVIFLEPDVLLVSQQPSGALVKIKLDVNSGRPQESMAHVIDSAFSGVHGLTLSKSYPGYVWVTLQFTSELILIDPIVSDIAAPPTVIKRLVLPAPAKGPHVIAEDGDTVWASCKDSHHLIQIRVEDAAVLQIIPCLPRPIFVQIHPTSKDVYATLDQSSALFRVPATSAGNIVSISIPADHGSTPVGMVPGPDNNLWFALLGDANGGNGSFGRILPDGQIEWFQLKNGPAANLGFIHIAFFSTPDGENSIALLASSMACMSALNAVVILRMNKEYSRIEAQQTIAFPSQHSMTHRVLSTPFGIYATELGTCCVAHLTPAGNSCEEGINELADPYSLWGCGIPSTRVRYPEEK